MELRELWLLRHAKADIGSDLIDDIDRPLSDRGKQDADRLGQWMRQQALAPDYIICSPAKRARQTAKRISMQLEIDPDTVHYDVQLYLASRGTLLNIVGATGLTCHKLLVVGHNPGLEDLLTFLCAGSLPMTSKGKLMTTANLVRIQLPDAWQWLREGVGKLLDITRPDQLR